jgi:hypothetical protein
MALSSDAMMVLFYDFEGNTADHDDWHSNQHFHERLSVPGFLRATRWVATTGTPRYLITYEISDVSVATSEGYLDRLNAPTPWTREMMPRFRGMTRGFCEIIQSYGIGLGSAAMALRFTPDSHRTTSLVDGLSSDVLTSIAAMPGIISVLLLRPAAPPPMTHEQSLRGPDHPMPWLVLLTAHDPSPLQHAATAHLDTESFRKLGVPGDVVVGHYALAHTATAQDAAWTEARLDTRQR